MKHPFRWISAGLVATTALTGWLVTTQPGCGQPPTNVPVRTFEGAGRMDILCMQVQQLTAGDGGVVGAPIPAIPVTPDHCAPVPAGTDLTLTPVPFHLIAVVTQTLRGEVAVVDLTAQRVVDTSLALPGTNFLPVGKNPTDIAVTPDAQKVFVTSADVAKPAIYMIPSTSLLGDSEVLAEPTQAAEQVTLPSWPACSLPQAPGRMVIVPTAATDAGPAGFEIVVVMPGNGTDEQSLVGLIDTAAFDSIAPGSLQACPIKSAIHLAENQSALPTSWTPGPAWPLGLPYLGDAGIDLFATDAGAGVQPSSNYKLPLWSCPSLAHTGPIADAGAPDAATLGTTPGAVVHGAGVATDGQFVYVADDAMPFIHVIDTRMPGTLSEIAPLVASSISDPTRVVTTSELAVSPVTRDYKRYLYAVDASQGNTVMVYDVTDPVNGPRTPLVRPNSELDPLQPPDRIAFSAPVSTLTFARHDFAVPGQIGATQTGVLCNPNPRAGAGQGVEYQSNGPVSVPLGPKRLRGVFAFATLSSGQVVAIDVDDWDAPCRRPLTLQAGGALPGSLAVPETDVGDTDPYHAPVASQIAADAGLESVSAETMWPIIQPNRIRSANLVFDDLVGINGLHDPALQSTPQLLVNGAQVAVAGSNHPILTASLPEFTTSIPATPQAGTPNVYMAHDVPDSHVADQTWNIVYEGALPGLDGIAATLGTTDNYATLTLSSGEAHFCGHGVQDQRVGLLRAAAMKIDDAALNTAKQSMMPINFDQRVGDYVQITDDIVGVPNPADASTLTPDPSDPIWSADNDCWGSVGTSDAATRQQVCIDKFGAYGADQNAQRDFPILEASDDHLVLGRYLYTDPTNRPTNGRLIAPRDTTSQVDFQLAKCCFHNQAHFRVRTGGEWVALGSVSGYLHHVVPDATKACVLSCDPTQVLMSSRAPETAFVPSATQTGPTPAPLRNSPFALRNPMFSFYVAAPVVAGTDAQTLFSVSVRDDTWQYTTRGQYQSEGVSLIGTNNSVLPQSSMFIAPLGAIGVIDASANGLYVIDLNTLSISDGSPFY
ncbi:MAG TPA: hypothetical protein VGH28_09780 [Polyangiaceae bacterium]|jgi:hypothetical protein